jgi:hypothetical protein
MNEFLVYVKDYFEVMLAKKMYNLNKKFDGIIGEIKL